MYRYSVDQTIVYTSDDFVLFRESPFACWMERLSLENPDHGVAPDVDSVSPAEVLGPQDELATTLLDDGKDVVQIDWQAEEVERRNATLSAMRHGVDFIVNGQLAVGPLSSCANLLMRTSGYSELGKYLYIPCDTQDKTTLNSAFRLCFLADMLHSLQGQVPPQMLILRDNAEVLSLQTEDHIYHYRAVKQRFMSAQRGFRKHRMPDPVDSAHFGRWSECANNVMKQRALGQSSIRDLLEVEEIEEPISVAKAAGGSPYDLDDVVGMNASSPMSVAGTLAEQARQLASSDTDLPSPGAAPDESSGHFEQLAFIGSGPDVKPMDVFGEKPEQTAVHQLKSPPMANLRNSDRFDKDAYSAPFTPGPVAVPDAVAPTAEQDQNSEVSFSSSLITNRVLKDS